MTTVGHGLTGLSFAILAAPPRWRWPAWLALLVAFVGLANVPDFDLLGWGHRRYEVSHSLFVNLALLAVPVLVLALSWRARDRIGGPLVVLLGATAWLSHLLLDSFYSHGQGIGIFWPWSEAHLTLTMPWFHVLAPQRRWTWEGLRIFGVEALFYGGLLVATLLVRLAVRRIRPRAR